MSIVLLNDLNHLQNTILFSQLYSDFSTNK